MDIFKYTLLSATTLPFLLRNNLPQSRTDKNSSKVKFNSLVSKPSM